MTTKYCSECESLLPATTEFFYRHKLKSGLLSLFSLCKACKKLRAKQYPLNTSKFQRAARIRKTATHKRFLGIQHHNQHTKGLPLQGTWAERYKQRHGKSRYQVRASNPTYRINSSMSGSIWRAVKTGKSGKSWTRFVDYTIDELKQHLQNNFKPGMSFNNYGLWHIDHIRPISSFGNIEIGSPEFKECWSLSNLQPLWAVDNLRKSDKYSARQTA